MSQIQEGKLSHIKIINVKNHLIILDYCIDFHIMINSYSKRNSSPKITQVDKEACLILLLLSLLLLLLLIIPILVKLQLMLD